MVERKCFWVIGSVVFVAFFPVKMEGTSSSRGVYQEGTHASIAQEHYSLLGEAVQRKSWDEAAYQAMELINRFPASPFYQEALYLLGVSYFYLEEYDKANEWLNRYLKSEDTLKQFHEAMELKFEVAEKFRLGFKKRIGGYSFLPKWESTMEEAGAIYDEIIQALPSEDLTAKALFSKALLSMVEEEYIASIEIYQDLIRRFPKHPLVPEAYLEIGKTYLIKSQTKSPDADYLDLAFINLRKFWNDFPNDERLEYAVNFFFEMQESYAKNFYEIAQFYERTKKKEAAILYYTKIVKAYPKTKTAFLANKKLKRLHPQFVFDSKNGKEGVSKDSSGFPFVP